MGHGGQRLESRGSGPVRPAPGQGNGRAARRPTVSREGRTAARASFPDCCSPARGIRVRYTDESLPGNAGVAWRRGGSGAHRSCSLVDDVVLSAWELGGTNGSTVRVDCEGATFSVRLLLRASAVPSTTCLTTLASTHGDRRTGSGPSAIRSRGLSRRARPRSRPRSGSDQHSRSTKLRKTYHEARVHHH